MAWTARIRHKSLAALARLLVGLVGHSSRLRVMGHQTVDTLLAAQIPVIHVFWHRHIFYLTYHFRRSGARPLISLSTDGELMAHVAEAFGMNPVRGSSSRGGARALLELVRTISAAPAPVLITADGPKGPAREVKEGAIELARRSGAAIVPIAWYGTRVHVLTKSWDRFLLPLPCGRIALRYGAAVYVGRNDDSEKLRRELSQALDNLEKEAISDCQAAPE